MNQNWKKTISLFLTGQTISLFGSMLVQYAIMWHITMKTQSGVMMTISILCGFIPTLILSPFAGVWADRFNRKMLIVLSDGMIAVATLLLAILFFIGYESIWLLFVASAIRSFGAAVQTPAVNAILPQLVPEDQLTRINGLNGSIQSFIQLLSPMFGGALLAMADLEYVFFIDVITAAIAISILLFFLHIPTHAKALEKQELSYFDDMMQGFRYLKTHHFVQILFLFTIGMNFLVTPVAFLTPLQVTRSFGNDIWRLTAIEMLFAGGMMIGGLLIAYIGNLRNKAATLGTSLVVLSAFTVLLGTVPHFWQYLLLMGLSGIAIPFFNTSYTVMLQQKVEEEFMGRIFGFVGMISSSVMPAAMLIFGPIADVIKIEWLLIGTGSLMLIESLLMLANKTLKEAARHTES